MFWRQLLYGQGIDRMDIKNIFKKENIKLIFEEKTNEGEFIAEVNDGFSEFSTKDTYNRDWAMSFPSGRYVIVVYQRHSLYRDGVQIYKNVSYENSTGRYSRYKKTSFVLLLDKEMEYTIPSWENHKLISHIVREDKNALHTKIFDSIEKAEKAAVVFSKKGNKVAILEWYEDFDMF